MSDGLKDLSKLVHKELRSYDFEILQSKAILLDDWCWACVMLCDALIGVVTCGVADKLLIATVCAASSAVVTVIGATACAVIASAAVAAICGAGVTLGSMAICESLHYCGLTYVDYCWWNEINNGFVINENALKGEPDNIYATMVAPNYGDGAHLTGHLEKVSSGGIIVHFATNSVPTVWIHVSLDNHDWRLIYGPAQQYANNYGMWYDIFTSYSNPYQYVSITIYDPNFVTISDCIVDSITGNY
jgi:hypothetical protein